MNPLSPELQHNTDSDLIRRSCAGDQNAFRSLVETHNRFAYALALRMLRNEDDACEVVQEAFIRVWNNIHRYRYEIKFTTWLYKIVVNLCYDRSKMDTRRRTMLESITAISHSEGHDDETDPSRGIERRELCDRIVAAAGFLPPMERLVFHLRDLQDLPMDEVAAITGISKGSVKTNLCHARKRIREIVAGLQEIDR